MKKEMRIVLSVISAAFLVFLSCSSSKENEVYVESEPAVEEDDHTCMVQFEKTSSTERFYVAVRDEYRANIWFVFRINHYVDRSASEYMDLWRVDWAYEGRYDSGNMAVVLDKILTNGENESVIKDYGEGLNTSSHIDTDDFTGGYHGDERIDLSDGCGATFYIDDKALSADELSSSFGWVSCDEFHYVQNSTMHKTALSVDGVAQESDHHVVAEHLKTTTFKDSGYVTENTIVLRDEIDFYWYFGICCIGTCVAELGCNEDMTPIVTFDRSGENRLSSTEHCEYRAWSDSNAIESHVKSDLVEGWNSLQCRMFVWDNGNYAKYYRRYPGSGAYRTTDGERFSSVMSVSFACR